MPIQDVTVPARICKCSQCGYEWITLLAAPRVPSHCQNRECRSREWNGVKERRKPDKKPQVVLPKPIKVRGGNDEGYDF